MGNIRSIQSAFDYLKVENTVINTPEQIKSSTMLILPGVGSFAKAMENIKNMNLLDSLNETILVLKRPVLGICLGMQLLADSGDEDGPSEGLGYIPGTVKKFTVDSSIKLPHIGFNIVNFVETNNLLFKGLGDRADFYFVHNYRFLCDNQKDVASFTTYGETFASSVAKDNVFGVQFHPEKSQSNGLTVLKNFVSI
jgi:glutamine amidotransferase